MSLSKIFKISASASVVLMGLSSGKAQSLTLNLLESPGTAIPTLINAVQAPTSGINVIAGTESFQGKIGDGTNPNTAQSATYTGFSLVPTSGSTPTLILPNGILLTSGTANLPTSNTANNFSNNLAQPGSGSNAALSTLSGKNTFDSNAISFNFTLSDPKDISVEADFIFGTDEFPTQSVTDIFGFFVDGVNYAKFPDGSLISNPVGGATNFINNPVGGGLYPIEYNGLSQHFTVVGLLNPTLTTHTIQIAVADTNDNIFDSGVFIGNLKGSNAGGGGIITPPEPGPTTTPEPSLILGLVALGAWGIGSKAKRKV